MLKFWNFTDCGGSDRALYIYGPIDDETWLGNEVTPKIFKDELDNGAGDLTVWVNSPGGDVFAAAQIYTMLREYSQNSKGRVTVKVDGVAASAASVVAMAGEKTLMSPVSYMIIHNPATVAFGDSEDMLRTKQMLEEIKEGIVNAYEMKTGMPREKISRFMDMEKWMCANEAVELGFADGILYTDSDKASAFKRYEKVRNIATQSNKLLTGGTTVITAMELREKRALAWEQAKAFHNSNLNPEGLLSDEDVQAYEKMEADVHAMTKEIEILERQTVMNNSLGSIVKAPLTLPAQPATSVFDDEKPVTGRASAEYNKAFWAVLRNPKRDCENAIYNALSVGVDKDGGYLVPDEFERTLIAALKDNDIMRGLARIITTNSGELRIPVVATRGVGSWVEEAGTIPESSGEFDQISLSAYKMGTMIKVSRELLEDSAFPIETFLADDFGRRLGMLEEEAFLVGDGNKKPTGVLVDAEIGVTAASAATITFDEVIKLFYSLRAPYRNKASFITNEQTVMLLRTLKDNNNQYLWQPSLTMGTPEMLLGRPVHVSQYVPTIAADAKVLLFGDFTYYWIGDRRGRTFDRLNELFAASDQVGFKATQRVDGRLLLPEAVKVLQMGS